MGSLRELPTWRIVKETLEGLVRYLVRLVRTCSRGLALQFPTLDFTQPSQRPNFSSRDRRRHSLERDASSQETPFQDSEGRFLLHAQPLDLSYDENDVEEQHVVGSPVSDSDSATSSEIMAAFSSLPRISDSSWFRGTRGMPEQAPAA